MIVVIAMLATCTLFFTQAGNQVVVDIIANKSVQSVSNHAAQMGIFDSISEHSQLYVIQGGWASEYEPESFVCLNANGLKIDPIKMNHILEKYEEEAVLENGVMKISPKDIYGFYAHGTMEDGYATIFLIDEIDYLPESDSIAQIYTTEMQFVYVGQGEKRELYIPRLNSRKRINGCLCGCFRI